MDAAFPTYTAAEQRADTALHAVGLTLGLAAMLACSALCNLADDEALARRPLLRRLDHAAIFLMIAGTCTPFALVAIGGAGASGRAFVWTAATFRRPPLVEFRPSSTPGIEAAAIAGKRRDA